MGKAIISTTVKGDYKKTYQFLDNLGSVLSYSYLLSVAKKGVEALRQGTPKDTGLTAASWTYYIDINRARGTCVVEWHNLNTTGDGHNVAIMLQYGHQTKNGSWVYGRDYINPAMQPIFDKMADEMWTKVVSK